MDCLRRPPFAAWKRLTLISLQIREGFIVDEDEEEEASDLEEIERRKKKKRPRVEEQLDEEDLDLIGEANPDWERKTQTQVCLLVRARKPGSVDSPPVVDQVQAPQARPSR